VERRLAVHARAPRQALIAALVCALAAPAAAAPKTRAAKAAFDRGVSAYQRKDFAAASAQLGKSYGLERDVETLFAWAQAERQLGHCVEATELYAKLLAADLPPANKAAIREKRDECKAILAADHPKARPGHPEPAPAAATVEPEPAAAPPEPPRAIDAPRLHARAWWNNPLGLSLVGVGAVGVASGAVFLHQASVADDAKARATTFADFRSNAARAHVRGTLGLVATGAGAAFVIAGAVYLATHRERERVAPTAWLGPSSTGVGLAGRF
jgi:hypothetical protein